MRETARHFRDGTRRKEDQDTTRDALLTVEKMIANNELLTPEQIYAALAYYHLNPAEIDTAIADDEATWSAGSRQTP